MTDMRSAAIRRKQAWGAAALFGRPEQDPAGPGSEAPPPLPAPASRVIPAGPRAVSPRADGDLLRLIRLPNRR